MSNMTIVDRVVERIKKQPLGDLIQEEDLHDIIKEAIPKAFFEKRVIEVQSGYNKKYETIEPIIVQALRESLESNVKEWIKNWAVENAEVVHEYWKKVMDEKLLTYVQKIQDEQATGQVKAALHRLMEDLNRTRAQNGQPMLYL